jgi:two-component system sensor histidine kinase YesM
LLAKSFRMMLKSGGQTIPLSEEIEFITNYLQLQKYRYPDKFEYSILISDELKNIAIPKLCIQPLVENSITHGIELKDSDSKIWIRGKEAEGKVYIIVEDNGLGILPERLAEINHRMQSEKALSKDKHIGLENVDRRLKHLYGDGYGLIVQSEAGKGTSVTITIPKPS